MKRWILYLLFIGIGISKSWAQQSQGFQMIPNPAQNSTYLEFKTIDVQSLKVEVFNLFGVRVNQVYVQSSKFENRISLYFPDVIEGVYLVRVQGPNFEHTQKLKIQR
jgi:hypothetical protein